MSIFIFLNVKSPQKFIKRFSIRDLRGQSCLPIEKCVCRRRDFVCKWNRSAEFETQRCCEDFNRSRRTGSPLHSLFCVFYFQVELELLYISPEEGAAKLTRLESHDVSTSMGPSAMANLTTKDANELPEVPQGRIFIGFFVNF